MISDNHLIAQRIASTYKDIRINIIILKYVLLSLHTLEY